MEVELFTEEMSDDENYVLDDKIEDYLDVDGERCGICMEIVIDRGVLDCCQHWFCFACIDNWATITSLCPLCQNEFQMITCVPVYYTVGGNKTDEDTSFRDEDLLIEGKSNSVSFPAYYIDENAVACLDGDGCKIRSASVAVEEDSDIDTSIACDSCDKWYHAYCVGFDPDGTCESSWLCPMGFCNRECDSFPVAASGSFPTEAEVLVFYNAASGFSSTTNEKPLSGLWLLSLQKSICKHCFYNFFSTYCEHPATSLRSYFYLLSITFSSSRKAQTIANTLLNMCIVYKVPPVLDQFSLLRKSYQHGLQITSGGSQVEDSLPGRVSVSIADDGETVVVVSLVEEEHEKSQESSESVLGCSKLKNVLSSSHISNMEELKPLLDTHSNTEPNPGQQESNYSPIRSMSIIHQNIDTDGEEKTVIAHLHNNPISSVDVKDNKIVNDQEEELVEPNIISEEGSLKADKMVHDNTKVIPLNSMVSDEKEATISSAGAKRKNKENRNANNKEREANTEAKFSQKKIKTERNAQTLKDQNLQSVLDEPKPIPRRTISKDNKLKRASENENATPDIMTLVQGTDRSSLKRKQGEKETASGLRLKKIMRRTNDDKDSSVLVQELREKIREAVRNKSSEKNLSDPKLLEAFRVAIAGSGTENRKSTFDVKAKKSILQKGKVRQSLTRKIYGSGGKRKRAWTRECEVEFWKHRCLNTSRPEKVETLKSVLDLLRDDSDTVKKMPGNEEEKSVSILSRLYLADNSVFPRKNDIVPISEKRESGLMGKESKSTPVDHPTKNSSLGQVTVPSMDSKGMKKSAKDKKVISEEVVSKPDATKGDKRKWALELLARKTATPGKKVDEKEEDNAILKKNYPLLAQLPKDMRPILAPCRHNKISMPVRQAQLNRLTEHFLKKANLSLVSKSAETELAVADAINIEKALADRSNSKLVYVNLCSQELLKRSDNIISNKSKESNTCSTSEEQVDRESENTNNSSLDMEVDEALRNTGLMSDSPPNSPNNSLGSSEKIEKEGPDNIHEVDSHPDLDIYGDFEYNLEEDDLIGSAVNISKVQQEVPKIKLVFSSINVEKPDAKDGEAVGGSSLVLESQNKTIDVELTVDSKTDERVIQSSVGGGDLTVDSKTDECVIQSSACDGDVELSLAECEELYGPDKEPISVKYPETVLTTTGENTVNHESKNAEKDSAVDSNGSVPKQSPSKVQKAGDVKEKTSKSSGKRSENYDEVVKKVEAYIKEHIRPLCKSGVITVDQYRWAVGKTTEKVMKYHSKEKNANFLIKEGEKVKKLAEQYVEAAPLKGKK